MKASIKEKTLLKKSLAKKLSKKDINMCFYFANVLTSVLTHMKIWPNIKASLKQNGGHQETKLAISWYTLEYYTCKSTLSIIFNLL